MYRLIVYIPESHCKIVKVALFNAGAGSYNNYSQCSWQTLGQGQFMASVESTPFAGEPATLKRLAEYQVEMIVTEVSLRSVIFTLRKAHPYEEPAFQVMQCIDVEQ